MTKILNPRLFEAVYSAVRKKIDARDFPQEYLPTGSYVERASDRQYVNLAPNGLLSKTSATEALKIRDAGWDSNRFTGISGAAGIKNCGGLYVYRQEEAGLAEFMHYGEAMNTLPVDVNTRRISVPHLLATKAVFRIRTLKPFILANVSPFSGGGHVQKFLRDVENDPAVKGLLGGVPLVNKILDAHDYSVGRAVGLAFATVSYLDGMQSKTARATDRYGTTGDNIVLFGENGKSVPYLEVESVTLTFSSSVLHNHKGDEIKLHPDTENVINTHLPNWTKAEKTVLIEVDAGLKMEMRVVKS